MLGELVTAFTPICEEMLVLKYYYCSTYPKLQFTKIYYYVYVILINDINYLSKEINRFIN